MMIKLVVAVQHGCVMHTDHFCFLFFFFVCFFFNNIFYSGIKNGHTCKVEISGTLDTHYKSGVATHPTTPVI